MDIGRRIKVEGSRGNHQSLLSSHLQSRHGLRLAVGTSLFLPTYIAFILLTLLVQRMFTGMQVVVIQSGGSQDNVNGHGLGSLYYLTNQTHVHR